MASFKNLFNLLIRLSKLYFEVSVVVLLVLIFFLFRLFLRHKKFIFIDALVFHSVHHLLFYGTFEDISLI